MKLECSRFGLVFCLLLNRIKQELAEISAPEMPLKCFTCRARCSARQRRDRGKTEAAGLGAGRRWIGALALLRSLAVQAERRRAAGDRRGSGDRRSGRGPRAECARNLPLLPSRAVESTSSRRRRRYLEGPVWSTPSLLQILPEPVGSAALVRGGWWRHESRTRAAPSSAREGGGTAAG